MTKLHMKFLSSSGRILESYCPVCGSGLDFFLGMTARLLMRYARVAAFNSVITMLFV